MSELTPRKTLPYEKGQEDIQFGFKDKELVIQYLSVCPKEGLVWDFNKINPVSLQVYVAEEVVFVHFELPTIGWLQLPLNAHEKHLDIPDVEAGYEMPFTLSLVESNTDEVICTYSYTLPADFTAKLVGAFRDQLDRPFDRMAYLNCLQHCFLYFSPREMAEQATFGWQSEGEPHVRPACHCGSAYGESDECGHCATATLFPFA